LVFDEVALVFEVVAFVSAADALAFFDVVALVLDAVTLAFDVFALGFGAVALALDAVALAFNVAAFVFDGAALAFDVVAFVLDGAALAFDVVALVFDVAAAVFLAFSGDFLTIGFFPELFVRFCLVSAFVAVSFS
jgi:hypothetical protein